MSSPDQIQRVIFENADVRSVLAGLQDSYQQVMARHEYPEVIRNLLGEMLAAVSLLSATLKFDGRLMLQARSDNQVKTLMAECTHQRDLRAIARFEGEIPADISFGELLRGGQLVITIEPDKGKRYQGVVPLEGDRLSQCLEIYFSRSEQLPTQIHLVADAQQAAGFLLQVMPAKGDSGADWQHFSHLGATLSDAELLTLDNETILHRLFHEADCRLYEAEPVRFHCGCSRQRMAAALKYMTQEELEEIIREEGKVEVNCQFCNENYLFDQGDITLLFSDSSHVEASDQIH